MSGHGIDASCSMVSSWRSTAKVVYSHLAASYSSHDSAAFRSGAAHAIETRCSCQVSTSARRRMPLFTVEHGPADVHESISGDTPVNTYTRPSRFHTRRSPSDMSSEVAPAVDTIFLFKRDAHASIYEAQRRIISVFSLSILSNTAINFHGKSWCRRCP